MPVQSVSLSFQSDGTPTSVAEGLPSTAAGIVTVAAVAGTSPTRRTGFASLAAPLRTIQKPRPHVITRFAAAGLAVSVAVPDADTSTVFTAVHFPSFPSV